MFKIYSSWKYLWAYSSQEWNIFFQDRISLNVKNGIRDMNFCEKNCNESKTLDWTFCVWDNIWSEKKCIPNNFLGASCPPWHPWNLRDCSFDWRQNLWTQVWLRWQNICFKNHIKHPKFANKIILFRHFVRKQWVYSFKFV